MSCLLRAYGSYAATKERQLALDLKTPGKSSSSFSKSPASVKLTESRTRHSAVLYSLYFVNLLYTVMWIFLSVGVFARAPVLYNYLLSTALPALAITTLTSRRTWKNYNILAWLIYESTIQILFHHLISCPYQILIIATVSWRIWLIRPILGRLANSKNFFNEPSRDRGRQIGRKFANLQLCCGRYFDGLIQHQIPATTWSAYFHWFGY
jgi:hypothetical protein